ncbi:MAG: hypothetical protein RR387_03630, partial [Clostridiales bacterium]
MDNQQTKNQIKKQNHKKNRLADIVAAILLISIALIVFYNLIDFWQSRSLGLQQVSYQTLTEAIPGEFVTIRSEYV